MSGTGDDRRKHARQSDPYLVVRFGGGEYSSVNWSYGGMQVSGYTGDLRTGALVTIDSMGPAGGPVEPARINARVVRVDAATGLLALAFLDIDLAAHTMLSRWYV